MSVARHLVPASSLLVLGTCCPSAWFTVTRRDHGPIPYLPVPSVDGVPIPTPPHYDNRFEILGDRHGPRDAQFYDDHLESSIDYTRALGGRRAILEKYGHRPEPPARRGARAGRSGEAIGAAIVAAVGPCIGPRQCRALVFPAGTPELGGATGVTVTLRGRRSEHAVQGCEPRNPGTAPVDCDRTPELCGDRGACKDYQGGTLMMVTQPLCTDCSEGDVVAVETLKVPRLSTTALSFIHLSDVQLRDGDVTLDDPDLSRRLDWIIQSFEYDPDQMAYGRYAIEGMFATINEAVARYEIDDLERPAFVIHTGDLIDAGVTSEAEIVHDLVDRFTIPFFDVIGNHDVLVFGNLLPPARADSTIDEGCVSAGSVLAPYVPYFQRHRPSWMPTMLCARSSASVRLIAAETHARSVSNFISHLADPPEVPSPALADATDAVPCASSPRVSTRPLTRNHGFDLNENKGYYAFARSLTLGGTLRRAFFIALDSMDLLDREGGNTGRIRRPQFQWLEATLACAGPQDLVFLFAHHGLSDIIIGDGVPPRDRNAPSLLEKLLVDHNRRQHNIIGFLYGHHHEHALCKEGQGTPRPTVCSSFYEIETAGVVEFPQEGRVVRIKELGDGIAFLELTTFGARLADGNEFSNVVARARRGAERDHCRTKPDARCSEDLRPYRDDGEQTNARLFFALPENAPHPR